MSICLTRYHNEQLNRKNPPDRLKKNQRLLETESRNARQLETVRLNCKRKVVDDEKERRAEEQRARIVE